ncbi:MAG: signal peptidase I [Croceibacterium sp.]
MNSLTSETAPAEVSESPKNAPGTLPVKEVKKDEGNFAVFLIKLVVAVLLFRTLLFTSFMIPSESMMPRLLVGDYLFAAKWPYGYSQASLPLDYKLWKGRIPAGMPSRGDVVIFKHPIDRTDYVKRVIGLPGDTVQMVAGVLHLNGQPVPKVKIANLVVPVRPLEGCREVRFTITQPDGSFACSYPRFHETLPSGVGYDVLDFGLTPQDTTAPVVVPEGRLFMMGDNRDNSEDSRFPPVAGEGVGLVPIDNVVGRASFMFFSTDGHAEWAKPWTWFTAARWSRIGHSI